MKRFSLILALASFVVMASGACKSDDDTTLTDAALLLALTSNTSSSLLTPQQQQTTAAASAASGAASSANSAAGGAQTYTKQKFQDIPGLYLAIMQNGKDPAFLQEIAKRLHNNREKVVENPGKNVELAALSVTQNGTANGYKRWTITGSVDGFAIQTRTLELQNYFYFLTSSCPYTYTGLNTSVNQGTATYNSMDLTYTGTGTTTGFNGSSTLNGSITFANYGTQYLDYYTYFTMLQRAQAGESVIPVSLDPCQNLKNVYDFQFNLILTATLGGTVTMNSTSSQVGNSNGSGATFSSSYSSTQNTTLNSSDFTVDGSTVTMDNVVYNLTSNTSFTGTTYSGSMSITMTGTLNGTALNENLTVNF